MTSRLAISNIAWPAAAADEVLDLLARRELGAIEVAPTLIWPNPAEVALSEVRRYREDLARRGVRVVAAQALLFGRPDLTIFADAGTRRLALEYLGAVTSVCAELGAEALVFGSPKNRLVGDLDPSAAAAVAEEFFGALAELAERRGTVVVVEANPREYQADFLTRAAEAADLVRRVGRPGLRLHLDTACMSLAGDDVEAILHDHAALLHHFHISEPYLAPVQQATIDHARFAAALRRVDYAGWVSIEMRAAAPFSIPLLDDAISWARTVYSGETGGRKPC